MGLGGNDNLSGGNGNDTLNGGTGNDTMIGGVGNDVYIVDSSNDVVTEALNQGTDLVNSSITYTLGANLENLTLTDTTNINGTGNTLNNNITGNSGNNILNGGDGNDTLIGGAGDDNLNGGVGNDSLDGGTGINTLNGGDGNDTLIPATGNSVDDGSTVNGGIGNDTLIVNFTNADSVGEGIYNDSEGINQNFWNNRVLTINNVEIFNIIGTPYNDHFTVEEGDSFDGSGGYDTLTLNFATATGNVQVNFAQTTNQVTYNNTVVKNFENIGTVTTGSGNDVINLGSGNGVDDGGTVDGGIGNDTLIVNFTNADSVGEGIYNDSEGINQNFWNDRVLTINNVEIFNITGTPYADDLRGFALNDTLNGGNGDDILKGFVGNDSLDGGNGADTMIGGAGNDIYTVNSTGDRITENVNEGTDTVQSSITYTLGNNLENLILTGTGNINGTGNTLNNFIIGNSGNNSLNGGDGNDSLDGDVGNDTLVGGVGNDTYIVDNVGDVVTEALNAGTDSVNSSVTYTLAVNVENLTLTGTGNINGTGNALANRITGNSGNNTLNGGDGNDSLNGGVGNDTLIGGNGNDLYIIDNTGDRITESANQGIDRVISSVTYTLSTNVENLTLTGTTAINGTGNTLNNLITGNSGNNNLNGGVGNDTLVGGNGNDTYIVDNLGDVIQETSTLATEIDTVQSSITYILGANLENLTLTGATAINGTGNTLSNTITGNTANNRLDGGGGNDTLTGGAGNDTLSGGIGADSMVGGTGNDLYGVDNTGDIIIEALNAGIDTVNSAITYTLGANLENLTLTGTANINGTGNTLNNIITGNSGNNRLDGGGGNDTLIGGIGNDTLTGATGNDFFRFNSKSEGNDSITDYNVTDDTIQVAKSGFDNNLVLGALATTQFTIGSSATTSAHRFFYNSTNGGLFFDVDGNGASPSVQFATLNTGLAMTNADIVVI
jgi:Ca2+-binding RTX toxin-like protein